MRILHTSDWHLGRTFHGRVLDDAQHGFADHLVEVVEAEDVDAVVMCGDVYDRSVPPTSAVGLLNDTVRRLADRTQVILTPGNHDSATRLDFGSALMRPELAVRAHLARVGEPVLLPDRDGGTGAYVYALPYLDPDSAREELPPLLASHLGEQVENQTADRDSVGTVVGGRTDPRPRLARSHEAVVSGALRLVAHDLAARRSHSARRVPALVMAHAFVAGGQASPDSERDLRVGGVDSVPAGVFTTLGGSPEADRSGGLDYVALGHLHRPQEIHLSGTRPTEPTRAHPTGGNCGGADAAGQPRLVYSGSPLAFSFSEAPWAKSTVLLDLETDGVRQIERIPVPVAHPVVTVEGSLSELLSPTTSVPPRAWVRAIVHSALGPGDQARLREHLGEVLAIQVHLPQPPGHVETRDTGESTDPVQVAARFVRDVRGEDPSPAEHEVLAQAYEAVLAAERSR